MEVLGGNLTGRSCLELAFRKRSVEYRDVPDRRKQTLALRNRARHVRIVS